MNPPGRVLLSAGVVVLALLGPAVLPDAAPAAEEVSTTAAAPPTALRDLVDHRLGAAGAVQAITRSATSQRTLVPRDGGACPAGVVVLTFDDGPDPRVTPVLVRMLVDLGVPATFFMVGRRVDASPATARLVSDAGFTIANHSYDHALMTGQSDEAIRRTLRRTAARLREAGLRPSRLMRPPYGGTDRRVDRAIRSVGLVPVLWDVDPRDWEPRSSDDIARGVLRRLRPQRSNVVLQHDGIRNSPRSVAAVPRIVRQARKRGYCFGDLDDQGRPTLPTPRISGSVTPTTEGDRAVLTLRLNAAAPRRTRVVVGTVDGTAVAGQDYRPREVTVTIPAGSVGARVAVRTRRDGIDERTEHFTFTLSRPRGLHIATPEVRARILDADPPPRARLVGGEIAVAPGEAARGTLTVRLSGPSGRPVTVRIRRAGTGGPQVRRTVVVPPGQREATVAVRVVDPTGETATRTRFRITGATNARPHPAPAVVVARPS